MISRDDVGKLYRCDTGARVRIIAVTALDMYTAFGEIETHEVVVHREEPARGPGVHLWPLDLTGSWRPVP